MTFGYARIANVEKKGLLVRRKDGIVTKPKRPIKALSGGF